MVADTDSTGTSDLIALTTRITAAYAGGNKIAAEALPGLIRSVHAALHAASTAAQQPAEPERKPPAVPIKRSVHREYIVCLEDGAHVRVLTRYLKRFGLTPETYRAKWDLPKDYPMVAPAFAEQRSAVAKQIGLGRKRTDAPAAAEEELPDEPPPPVQAAAEPEPEAEPEEAAPQEAAPAKPARKPAANGRRKAASKK